MRRADRQQYRQAAGAAAEARLMRQLIKTAALTLLPLVLAGYEQAAENAPKVITLSCDGTLTRTYGASKPADLPEPLQKIGAVVNLNERVGMALSTLTLIAGCAAETGVVPTGQNSYLVAKQAATGFPGLGNLKADALQEANQFCASKGSDLFVTRSSETQPPYVLGNYPRAEIAFRCGSPNAAAEAAIAECKAKRLGGELKTQKFFVECSNPKIFAAYREAGDPNLDLLNVYLAARLVGAENVDKKRVTEAEYKLQLAELDSRLTKERQRRALAVADLEIKRAQAAAETQTAQAAQAQSNAACRASV
jgi:hypothetical protein